MRKRMSMFFILAAAFALVIAGCGQDNDASSTSDKEETLTVKHELDETKVKKNRKKWWSLTSVPWTHWTNWEWK